MAATAPGPSARRQAGLTALYLGIFAALWFSVPQTDPPLRTVGAVDAA